MPLFTRTFQIIGGLLYVPVFATAILGASYGYGVLTHLADVVNGSNTATVVATNAPNWEFGLPVTSPLISSIATSSNGSAASGLASSTPYVFEVAALDGTGTTTLVSSATITTDASTTQNAPEDINISWTSVNGATGYAIFFGTSTVVGTGGLTQYFLATTSGTYNFATSSGSLSGSYTKSDTTAFSEVLNPNGTDIFNDNLNSATSSRPASTTAVQINGTAVVTAGATTTACEADTAGAIFFNTSNSHEWGCNGTAWTKIF
jgi:hypothetical protein